MIAMLWLTGCATVGSEALARCPPVIEYTNADQARAVAEVDMLPTDGYRAMSRYGKWTVEKPWLSPSPQSALTSRPEQARIPMLGKHRQRISTRFETQP
jgi:hypothetical protein